MRTFERYLCDIGRERLLTPEEEAGLARRSQAGDESARRRLVSANLRFVVSVARGFRGRGVPLVDLVNEGNLGLLRAAMRFDAGRGVRFISYAHFWVRRAMLRAIADAESPRPPSGLRPARVSLDAPVGDARTTLAEVLADERAGSPEERVARLGLRRAIESSLVDLPPRERRAVRRYFGLDGSPPHTLAEIADDLGVTRERARQLKEQGLARLRAAAPRHGLAAFGPPAPTASGRRPRRPPKPHRRN